MRVAPGCRLSRAGTEQDALAEAKPPALPKDLSARLVFYDSKGDQAGSEA